MIHERTKDDPQPPVIADLRDLLGKGPTRCAGGGLDDPENDEALRAQVAAFWPTCTDSRTA